jgi:hypothetical protein
MPDLLPFAQWLRATPASEWVNSTPWLWPMCESLHFIGLSLLVGIAGFFDLRLMGFFARVPIAAAKALMPFAMAGFAINLVTGSIFLTGLPEQYVANPVWWSKVGFLAVAGANAFIFETRLSARVLAIEPGNDTPRAAKIIGFVSIVSWFAVLYCGRMLAFLGDAF